MNDLIEFVKDEKSGQVCYKVGDDVFDTFESAKKHIKRRKSYNQKALEKNYGLTVTGVDRLFKKGKIVKGISL